KLVSLSETRPSISVLPTVNGLDNVAKALTSAVSGIWDNRGIEYATERVGIWGCIAGAAFVGTPYNKLLNNGMGDADFVVKDPRACGMDMAVVDARDGDRGEYCYIEDFVPLDLFRSEYPGRGALVKPDARVSGFDSGSTDTSARTLIRGAFSRLFRKKDPEKVSAIPKAIIEEFYLKDRRLSIEDTGTVPIVENITDWAKDKGIPFPGGRRILRAGDIILEDSFNPFWDAAPPLDMMSWKVDPETAWGADEIRGVKRMQQAVNRLGDGYTKTALLNSVVRLVMDSGALTPQERNKLSNEVGQIIEKMPGRTLEYMVPELLKYDVVNFINQLITWMEHKMGVTEPPTKQRTPSIVTGPAIEGLQLMLDTPIRSAARKVEEFYQRIGQKLISRVFQYYTSNRMIHLIGPEMKWIQFEFKRLEILKDKKGNQRSQEDLRKAYQDFRFLVEPGSSLAITKQQRSQAKFLLVQLKLLHPKEILSEFYANPEEKMAEAAEAQSKGLFAGMEQGKTPVVPGSNGSSMAAYT